MFLGKYFWECAETYGIFFCTKIGVYIFFVAPDLLNFFLHSIQKILRRRFFLSKNNSENIFFGKKCIFLFWKCRRWTERVISASVAIKCRLSILLKLFSRRAALTCNMNISQNPFFAHGHMFKLLNMHIDHLKQFKTNV